LALRISDAPMEGIHAVSAAHAAHELQRQLARDLHDEVASPLISLLLGLREMRQHRQAESAADGELAIVEDSVRDVLRRTREMLIDLRGQGDIRLNFAQVIRHDVLSKFEHSVRIAFRVARSWPEHINGWSAFNLSRIIHEAVSNAVRHGRATSIEISLDVNPLDEAVVLVVDDGAGFDGPVGLGITGMEERTVILGGTFQAAAAPVSGTRVEIRIPRYRLD